MADWYISSTAYAAIPVWQANTAYTIGSIIRPTALTNTRLHAQRCTTSGTTAATEPSWNISNNDVTNSGTASFTNVAGQSAYFWAAASGDFGTVTNDNTGVRAVSGDRIFVSSDHVETSGVHVLRYVAGWTGVAMISVNRAGSTPPAPADVVVGATIAPPSVDLALDPDVPALMQGFIITSNASVFVHTARNKTLHLRNCALRLTGSSTGSRMLYASQVPSKVILNNTTMQFGSTAQMVGGGSYVLDLTWLNTPSAIQGGILPTSLFTGTGITPTLITCRGVDFSALTTAFVNYTVAGGAAGIKLLLDSCRIAPTVLRFTGSPNTPSDLIELVNCYDGTNTLNERHVIAGTVTTERTITLLDGAADSTGPFSHKMISTTFVDKGAQPLESFWFEVGHTVTGATRTATVEIISSASLNNDDVWLLLEYSGTPVSPIASFATSLPTTILTAPSAITASSATWNSSPATPVKQKLQITFTPLVSGRVRGMVRLGKASTTVYVNPVITVT